MKQPNPEHVEKLKSLIAEAPFFVHMTMRALDIGTEYAAFELDLDANKHIQPFGNVHGGVIASIIDSAAFWCSFYSLEDPNAGLTTVDLKVNYLAPVASGKLTAKGRLIKLGRTLGYSDAEVWDTDGRLIAHGTSTLIVIPDFTPTPSPPFPPKFIE